MRVAVFGGPYANPYALRALLTDAARRGCDERWCLGDLGGFGAEVEPLWPLLVEHDVTCIAGNYDLALAAGAEDCGCGYADPRDNALAQEIYDHTRAVTSPAFAEWMGALPGELRTVIGGVDVLAVHGSPVAVNDFLWESLTDEELRGRLDACGGGRPDVLLCTHTGIAWQRRVDATLIVNVGAIGRPANDGRTTGWYAVVDLSDGAARADLVAVEYDWHAQAASMRSAGLPECFVETIETGWWTTCLEIVPPAERARGRYHVYRDALPAGDAAQAGWADPVDTDDDGLPVVSLFGTALFPPRLWLYTNFHCNLACGYCVVASSPRARRRELTAATLEALADEAVAEGFTEIYLTGGEPFVRRDAANLVEMAAARLPTVVLTNAMLFAGPRRQDLARLAGLDVVLQSSLDSATPHVHDLQRGSGSWERALTGIRAAAALGMRVRVAMTETDANRGDGDRLRELLDGVAEVAVRPLVARGGSDAGLTVSDAVIVPELTVTADGVHWHPLGADRDASPDFLVGAAPMTLAEGKQAIVERFLTLRRGDGSLPEAFACAI